MSWIDNYFKNDENLIEIQKKEMRVTLNFHVFSRIWISSFLDLFKQCAVCFRHFSTPLPSPSIFLRDFFVWSFSINTQISKTPYPALFNKENMNYNCIHFLVVAFPPNFLCSHRAWWPPVSVLLLFKIIYVCTVLLMPTRTCSNSVPSIGLPSASIPRDRPLWALFTYIKVGPIF